MKRPKSVGWPEGNSEVLAPKHAGLGPFCLMPPTVMRNGGIT